jgi:hypothetical protein
MSAATAKQKSMEIPTHPTYDIKAVSSQICAACLLYLPMLLLLPADSSRVHTSASAWPSRLCLMHFAYGDEFKNMLRV